MEEIEMVLGMAKEGMASAIEHLNKEPWSAFVRVERQLHYVGYGLCGLLWVT